jgi:hypothetical protein
VGDARRHRGRALASGTCPGDGAVGVMKWFGVARAFRLRQRAVAAEPHVAHGHQLHNVLVFGAAQAGENPRKSQPLIIAVSSWTHSRSATITEAGARWRLRSSTRPFR